jgi:hypothetical protein
MLHPINIINHRWANFRAGTGKAEKCSTPMLAKRRGVRQSNKSPRVYKVKFEKLLVFPGKAVEDYRTPRRWRVKY